MLPLRMEMDSGVSRMMLLRDPLQYRSDVQHPKLAQQKAEMLPLVNDLCRHLRAHEAPLTLK